MDKEDLNLNEVEDEKRKRKICLLICLIVLLVMMLPSTIAFFTIFK
ncbi:MAG: hypothetical protein ACFFC3_10930 [Candidatus Odinarchaeota archaeon]